MVRRGRAVAVAVALAGVAALPRLAEAQVGARPNPGAMSANPYANPYANPFLNPYMTQTPSQGNPALYFLAAQQYNGGIGSGQLSGTRPAPATASPAGSVARRASDVPGGGASVFFNRAPRPTPTAGRHYNRPSRYYPANGH